MFHRHGLLLLVILSVAALETGHFAFGSSIPLPSSSQPIYSSYADGMYAVAQADGHLTFSSSGSSFSVLVPSTLSGNAYHVYNAQSTTVDLAVAGGTQIWMIRCYQSSGSCSLLTNPVLLPLSFANPKVITMRTLSNDNSIVVIVTADTIVTWNVGSMHKISSVTWSLQNPYTLNHVSGVRLSGTGPYYLMVGMANSAQPSKPGVVVKVTCNSNGQLGTSPHITYMTIAPMNFVTSESYPTVKYWTQNDFALNKGYVSSFAGQAQAPATTSLGSGQMISPSFVGEYPMTQVGIMAVGNPNSLGYDLLCLHFGYGMSFGPEVWISERRPASKTMGLPILGVQVGSLQAEVMAVSRTSSGWSIVSIYFGNCPMGFKATEARALAANADSETKKISALPFDQNCNPSTCSIENQGDCTPQRCWGDARTGGYRCCKSPPV